MLDNKQMAQAVRSAIADAGLTLRQVGEHFDITEQAVSGWMRTGKLDKRKIPALAKLTGKPMSHFGFEANGSLTQGAADTATQIVNLLSSIPPGVRPVAGKLLESLASTPDDPNLQKLLRDVINSGGQK